MRTISIADLKAHLSAELKKVQAGDPVTVLDHKRPVAVLTPIPEEVPGLTYTRRAVRRPQIHHWEPLTDVDPLPALLEDREDRW
jgi:prevent-host-death family protein